MTPALALAFALLATPTFPGVIQQELGTATKPRCTICHGSEAGGGPVVQPFGIYMESRGLRPFNEDSLRGALAACRGEHHDSSGEGIGDIEALVEGKDPNGRRAVQGDLIAAYGCSTSLPPDGAMATLAILGWLLGRRFRHRPAPADGRSAD